MAVVQAAKPNQDGQHRRRAAAVHRAVGGQLHGLCLPAAAAHHADGGLPAARAGAQEVGAIISGCFLIRLCKLLAICLL